jgi:hypothetical protein
MADHSWHADLELLLPREMPLILLMQLPESQAPWRNPNDTAQAFRLSLKLTRLQEPADIVRSDFIFDIEVYQAISLMTEPAVIETAIKSEECRLVHLTQPGDYMNVFHSCTSDVLSNLSDSNALFAKQLPLAFGDILVKDIHAG